MMSQSNQALTVASFYSFSRLSNLKTRRVKLLTLCNSLRLRGTLLLAEEGVNGTISGRQNQVESLVSHLRSWSEMNDFEVKYSTSLEQNFNRMKVKIKDEIVTMGEPYIDAATDSGQYVDHFEQGFYCCKACGSELYRSAHKFKSSCGWPSFDSEIKGAIDRKTDNSFGSVSLSILGNKKRFIFLFKAC